jgi:hypothetical protein
LTGQVRLQNIPHKQQNMSDHQQQASSTISLVVKEEEANNNLFNLPLKLVDPYTLSVCTYLQFCQLPYQRLNSNNHQLSNTLLEVKSFHSSTLPILYHNGKQASSGAMQTIDYLKSRGVNLDLHLNIPDSSSSSLQQIQSEIDIFISLMNDKLLPLLLWHIWGFHDYEDYCDLVWDGWFKNASGVSKWMFLPLSRKRFGDWLSPNKDKLETNAIECLDALSVLLGDKKYFYGSVPSTLDAVVFSYLASFRNINFKSTVLRDLVNRYSNLNTLIETVINEYFDTPAASLTTNNYQLKSDQQQQQQKSTTRSRGYVNKNKNWYLAVVLGSISIYVLYSLRHLLFANKIMVMKVRKSSPYYYDNQSEEHDDSSVLIEQEEQEQQTEAE